MNVFSVGDHSVFSHAKWHQAPPLLCYVYRALECAAEIGHVVVILLHVLHWTF